MEVTGPPRAAVLGGTGFIGRNLVPLLVKAGFGVTVISRSGARTDRDPSVKYLRGDLADADNLLPAFADTTVVFHLATGGGRRWADFERDCMRGTRIVAEACLKNGVQRLVYVSSIAALDLACRRTVTELDGHDQYRHRRCMYSRGKIDAERVLRELHCSARLPMVIVRPGVVMGPGGTLTHAGLGNWPSDTCCVGWGNGRNPLPLVLVDDVARALLAAALTPGIEGKTFNLAGDVHVSAFDFMRILRERSQRNFRFYPQSIAKLYLLLVLKWIIKQAVRQPGNYFPSWRELRNRRLLSHLDCSTAKQLLDWKPNSNPEAFFRLAIDSHLNGVAPGVHDCVADDAS